MLFASFDELKSSTEISAYGGDAYTGIQNAAAYTEQAVIEAANSQGEDARDLKRVLAGLLIGSGLLNIAVTFRARPTG